MGQRLSEPFLDLKRQHQVQRVKIDAANPRTTFEPLIAASVLNSSTSILLQRVSRHLSGERDGFPGESLDGELTPPVVRSRHTDGHIERIEELLEKVEVSV